jgi:hypothetical protein
VTEGQASAMIPTTTARMPRQIRDVLSDLNMTAPFARSAARAAGVPHPAGLAFYTMIIITDV